MRKGFNVLGQVLSMRQATEIIRCGWVIAEERLSKMSRGGCEVCAEFPCVAALKLARQPS